MAVNKARVAGIDKDSTKTGEARRVMLCPRALLVLKRQLALRAQLQHEGRIHHEQLFFKGNGEPIRNLLYPYSRWRQTLHRLRMIRYRKPYCARHSSVSWNLMIGNNPLWVAKQHGHTITTMLKAYAAWTEGAPRSDIQAIKRAMAPESADSERMKIPNRTVADAPHEGFRSIRPKTCTQTEPGTDARSSSFATGFATRHRAGRAKCSKRRGITGGERGIRTLEGLLTLTPLAGPAVLKHKTQCNLHYLTALFFVVQSALHGILMGAPMEDLISFSLRIPKALAANIEVTAKRLGMSKSEYARRAMEEFEERLMQERIAELSRQLAAHSASAALSMEGSTSDGLE